MDDKTKALIADCALHFTHQPVDALAIKIAKDDIQELIRVIREQDATYKLLEGEFSAVISGVANELVAVGYVDESGGDGIVLAIRHVLQKQAAEIERLKRLLPGRHEEETGVTHGDYNQHREMGWACNLCGQFSGNESDPCDNCDVKLSRLKAAIRRQTVDVDDGNKPNGPAEEALEGLAQSLTVESYKKHGLKAFVVACEWGAKLSTALTADTKELCEAASVYFNEDFNKP